MADNSLSATELVKARNALRNLIVQSEYNRTGKLPTSEDLDHSETWWLTFATELHSWDKRRAALSVESGTKPIKLREVCYSCDKEISGGHECPVKLSEQEQAALGFVMRMEFCDHFCCGDTPQVCHARSIAQFVGGILSGKEPFPAVESGEGTPQLKDSVVCAARHSDTGANDPQECDWPFCGCDPHADKVIESLLECGWMSGQEASRLKIAYGKLFNENAAMTGLLEDSRDKLRSLYNEVHGAFGFAGIELRSALGNTNFTCIQNRLNEANETLAARESTAPRKDTATAPITEK